MQQDALYFLQKEILDIENTIFFKKTFGDVQDIASLAVRHAVLRKEYALRRIQQNYYITHDELKEMEGKTMSTLDFDFDAAYKDNTSYFMSAPNVKTTVSVGIDAFTAALCFDLMQSEVGKAMIAKIAGKTVADQSLIKACEVTSIEASGNQVNIQFEAKEVMLKTLDPRAHFEVSTVNINAKAAKEEIEKQKKAQEPYIYGNAIDWSMSATSYGFASLSASSENAQWHNPFSVSNGTQRYDITMGTSPDGTPRIEQLKATVAPPEQVYTQKLDTIFPFGRFPSPATPIAEKHAAFDILDKGERAVSDGTYIITRTALDTLHVYEDDDDGDYGERLFVSGGSNYLEAQKGIETFFSELADKHFTEYLNGNVNDAQFEHLLTEARWETHS